MTRINLVDPKTLSDQHLMAEFREIKHIPAFAVDRLEAGLSYADMEERIPSKFTLNSGHKWFFVDKHEFLAQRFELLHDELLRRGFNVDRKSVQGWYDWLNKIPKHLYNSYTPTIQDKVVSAARIEERISEKHNWYRYFGDVKCLEFFVEMLSDDLSV